MNLPLLEMLLSTNSRKRLWRLDRTNMKGWPEYCNVRYLPRASQDAEGGWWEIRPGVKVFDPGGGDLNWVVLHNPEERRLL